MKHTYIKNISIGLGVIAIIAGGIGFAELAGRLFVHETPVPEYLQLKTEPSEILYSKAYKSEKGYNEIKYAYIRSGEETVAPAEGEDVRRRTPTSQTAVLRTFDDDEGNTMEELKTTFISNSQFYQTQDGAWHQIEYATTTQEVFTRSGAIPHIVRREFMERLAEFAFGARPVFAATSTFNPDPDPEVTSVDGSVTNTGLDGETFSSVRNAATGTNFTDAGTTMDAESNFFTIRTSSFYTIDRMFVLFDTSSLTSAATISSGTFSIFITGTSNLDNDGTDDVNLITTTPASNTVLANGDYNQVGSTLQASAIDITSISISAYLDFPLNGTGLGNISKTGITKFGVREGHDLDNLPPIDTSRVTASTAEATGTSQDPKLVVVYTLPATFAFWQFFEL